MKIPNDFIIPSHVEFQISNMFTVTLSPLDRTLSNEDYKLIMSNKNHLKGLFGKLDDWWPSDTLSERENYEALLWHEKQFQERKSFAFSIKLDGQYIGCIYIYGLDEVYEIVANKNVDYMYIFMWTTEKCFIEGTDSLIFYKLKEWIEKTWNFAIADYPGRLTPIVSYNGLTAKWIITTESLI